MEREHITLTLPVHLMKRLVVIAAQQDTSVSALIERLLSEYLEQEDRYWQAQLEHRAILAGGFDLGTHGRKSWGREDLHDR